MVARNILYEIINFPTYLGQRGQPSLIIKIIHTNLYKSWDIHFDNQTIYHGLLFFFIGTSMFSQWYSDNSALPALSWKILLQRMWCQLPAHHLLLYTICIVIIYTIHTLLPRYPSTMSKLPRKQCKTRGGKSNDRANSSAADHAAAAAAAHRRYRRCCHWRCHCWCPKRRCCSSRICTSKALVAPSQGRPSPPPSSRRPLSQIAAALSMSNQLPMSKPALLS